MVKEREPTRPNQHTSDLLWPNGTWSGSTSSTSGCAIFAAALVSLRNSVVYCPLGAIKGSVPTGALLEVCQLLTFPWALIAICLAGEQ